MPIDTIAVQNGTVKILDQTLLPLETKYIPMNTIGEMWEAIKVLRIRGAPAIGIGTAFGIYLGVKDSEAKNFDDFWADFEKATDYLATARPTAVNLFWALIRIKNLVQQNRSLTVPELKELIFAEAKKMIDEDTEICHALGEHGAVLLKDGDGMLTHCNAGGLATAKYGTALAPVYVAKEQGKKIRVFSDETRPLLQGARLTAWELHQEGIDVTLICDNMAATVMAKGWVQCVIVGTDRTAANGDVANKIGTYGVALLAKAHNIPFYVAAPLSSIDMSLSDGSQIPIEERDPKEISQGFGAQTAPNGIEIYNPAFDVTPNELVTGIITEKGIVYPPYRENLKKIFDSI